MMPWPWMVLRVAQAASVTVSPGDDLNALTSSLQAGDVVTFNPGTYELEGTVYWTGIGTEDAPIEFRAKQIGTAILHNAGGGYTVQLSDSDQVRILGLVFEGTGEEPEYYDGASGIALYNSSNVTLEDNVVRDVWGTALRIDGNASGLDIRHNEFGPSGDGGGIYVGCGDGSCWMQDSTIEFNLIHEVAYTGIYLSPGTQGCTFQHNVIYQTGDQGMVIPNTLFGEQNVVFGNAIWQTEDDGLQIFGSALVQNNLLFEIGGDGIDARDEDDTLEELQISHNTIARTDGWGVELRDWFDRPGLVFANNAIANATGYGLYWEDWRYGEDNYGNTTTATGDDTSNYISNNVVTGLVDGFDLLIRDGFVLPGGGISDYASVADWDFYPTSSSQLRDAADAAGDAYIPQDDFNGTARDGESPDVGAYEYDGEGNPGWVVKEGYKEYSPNEGRPIVNTSGGCCGGGAGKKDPATAALLLPLIGLAAWRRRRK